MSSAGNRDAEAARSSFRPEEVEVLLIGESRPAGGTFFYFGDSILWDATREAFNEAGFGVSPDDFLPAFRDLGCYLEDLCQEPVNRMDAGPRQDAREAGIPSLAKRLEGMQPDVVIVVMKEVKPQVGEALTLAGLGSVPVKELPFPLKKHRRRYVDGLSRILSQWLLPAAFDSVSVELTVEEREFLMRLMIARPPADTDDGKVVGNDSIDDISPEDYRRLWWSIDTKFRS